MFKLQANPTFEAPVKIPSPDGELTLVLIFKHKTRAAMKAFFEEAAKGAKRVEPAVPGTDAYFEPIGETTPGEDDARALMEIVAGWKDVDAEFSEQAMAELVQNYYGAVPAIFDAYVQALTQAKRGNSDGSPASSTK